MRLLAVVGRLDCIREGITWYNIVEISDIIIIIIIIIIMSCVCGAQQYLVHYPLSDREQVE